MTGKQFWMVLLAMVLFIAVRSSAQDDDKKNELSGIIGRTFISNQGVPSVGSALTFGNGLSFEVNYGRHFMRNDIFGLTLEVPALINYDEDLHFVDNVIPEHYRAFFMTPSARINLFPKTGFSPWGSGGVGFAYFSEASTLEYGGANPGKTGTMSRVIQFGGGLDVHLIKSLRLRGELRDYISGVAQLNVTTGKSHQHNLFVGGGIVWNF
jgi:hypothetical protein